MDNLSELSKPKAFVVTGGTLYQDRAFTDKSTAERSKVDRHDGAVVEPLYSQEYVSALLAELKEKDGRIAELERANTSQDDHINQQQDRIESLEKTNAGLGRRLRDAEKRIIELDYLRLSACEVFKEIGTELGCNPDNESIMMAIDAQKERLATPVRLPTKYSLKMAGDKSTRAMFSGHNSAINDSADAIRAAGFTVEGD